MRRRRVVWQTAREAGIWFAQQGLNHCHPSESSCSKRTDFAAAVGYRTVRKGPSNGHKSHQEIIP